MGFNYQLVYLNERIGKIKNPQQSLLWIFGSNNPKTKLQTRINNHSNADKKQ